MDPYVGEIRMFAGTFAPVGWELCHGQPLPIAQNDVLFSLIGTIYGGDGMEWFNLPDLRGRAPVHFGQGPGLTSRELGDLFGTESETLTTQQIPQHGHALQARAAGGTRSTPDGAVLASPSGSELYVRDTPATQMGAARIEPAGGSQPHDNRMPYLTINFIIALVGLYPSQT